MTTPNSSAIVSKRDHEAPGLRTKGRLMVYDMLWDVCECADPGCRAKECKGSCVRPSETVLFRIDMQDETGTRVCAPCACDMMDSGVFADCKPDPDIVPLSELGLA